MTELMEKLFLYVVEKDFHPYKDLQAYKFYACAEEKAEAQIRQVLPQEHAHLLEELHQAKIQCVTLEQEAAFQAGIAIGLELSRL